MTLGVEGVSALGGAAAALAAGAAVFHFSRSAAGREIGRAHV